MRVELIDTPIDVPGILADCEDPSCGAVSLFLGAVRNRHEGHDVDHIDYEAYRPVALDTMRSIARTAQERWNLSRLVLVHRVGRLRVGEVSVAVAVATPHRAQACEASRFIIDTLKAEVPIWKQESGPQGERWIEGSDIHPRPPA